MTISLHSLTCNTCKTLTYLHTVSLSCCIANCCIWCAYHREGKDHQSSISTMTSMLAEPEVDWYTDCKAKLLETHINVQF